MVEGQSQTLKYHSGIIKPLMKSLAQKIRVSISYAQGYTNK